MEEKLDRIIELLEKIIENQALMNGGAAPTGCVHEWIYINNVTAPYRYCKKCGTQESQITSMPPTYTSNSYRL